MKYKSCKYIQGGIAFRHDAVSLCNKLCGTKRYEKFNIPYIKGYYEKFINVREEAIENCKKGVLPHEVCLSARMLKKRIGKKIHVSEKWK